MKGLALLSLGIAFFALLTVNYSGKVESLTEEQVQELFLKYVEDFDKNYTSKVQEFRKKIFTSNV